MIDPTPTPDAPAPDLRAGKRTVKIGNALVSADNLGEIAARLAADVRESEYVVPLAQQVPHKLTVVEAAKLIKDTIIALFPAVLRAEHDEAQPVAARVIEAARHALWWHAQHDKPGRIATDRAWRREMDARLGLLRTALDAHPPVTSPGAPVCKDCAEMFGEPMPCAVPYDPPPKATSPGAAGDAPDDDLTAEAFAKLKAVLAAENDPERKRRIVLSIDAAMAIEQVEIERALAAENALIMRMVKEFSSFICCWPILSEDEAKEAVTMGATLDNRIEDALATLCAPPCRPADRLLANPAPAAEQGARERALERLLREILDYTGGAESALDDEYLMGRACAAIEERS
jgi:hypothetical protein